MIVVATDEEYERFKGYGQDVVKTGVGYGNVFKTLANIPRDTPILNIGYAGSNTIPIGEECTISECRHYHPNVEFDEASYKLDGKYVCYTSGDFVLQTDIKEPVVFDMELYAILAMGFTNVSAIKIISDNLSLKNYEENIKKGASL